MRITVPKDSAAEARVYLQAWMDLHEGPGMARVKKLILVLRILSTVAGIALVAGVFLGWNPMAIGFASIVLGYSGAEAASLMSRMRAWPHNEKYFDWEAIGEALKEENKG